MTLVNIDLGDGILGLPATAASDIRLQLAATTVVGDTIHLPAAHPVPVSKDEPVTREMVPGVWAVWGVRAEGPVLVEVPDSEGTVELKDLVEFGLSAPPDTPAATLEAAVDAWLSVRAAEVESARSDAVSAAGSATGAASDAEGAASAASGAATAASGSATAAAGSASSASTAATNAGNARTAAESARDAAQAARDETIIAVGAQTDWSGAVAVAADAVNKPQWWKRRLTGNAEVTLANGVAGQAYSIIVEVKQDATGGRSLLFKQSGGSQVSWAYGVTPVMSSAANARDLWTLTWTGSEWIGGVGGQALAIGTGTGV